MSTPAILETALYKPEISEKARSPALNGEAFKRNVAVADASILSLLPSRAPAIQAMECGMANQKG